MKSSAWGFCVFFCIFQTVSPFGNFKPNYREISSDESDIEKALARQTRFGSEGPQFRGSRRPPSPRTFRERLGSEDEEVRNELEKLEETLMMGEKLKFPPFAVRPDHPLYAGQIPQHDFSSQDAQYLNRASNGDFPSGFAPGYQNDGSYGGPVPPGHNGMSRDEFHQPSEEEFDAKKEKEREEYEKMKLRNRTNTTETTTSQHGVDLPISRPRISKHQTGSGILSDFNFVVLVSTCTAVAIMALIGAGICYHRISRSKKFAADSDYPNYGVTGPNKDFSPASADRKLAQSAHMFHYQHQKQQMLAMGKGGNEAHVGSTSDVESEEDAEGDYTVYECPGLAPTSEMEVKNPLYSDDPTPQCTPPKTQNGMKNGKKNNHTKKSDAGK